MKVYLSQWEGRTSSIYRFVSMIYNFYILRCLLCVADAAGPPLGFPGLLHSRALSPTPTAKICTSVPGGFLCLLAFALLAEQQAANQGDGPQEQPSAQARGGWSIHSPAPFQPSGPPIRASCSGPQGDLLRTCLLSPTSLLISSPFSLPGVFLHIHKKYLLSNAFLSACSRESLSHGGTWVSVYAGVPGPQM